MAATSTSAENLDEQGYYQALASADDGKLGEAIMSLERFLAGHPHHAGAWLDLAILQCRIGQQEGKSKALLQLKSLSNSESLPSIIQELVQRLEAETCTVRDTLAPPSLKVLRITAGRAQNLNFGASHSEITLPSAATLRLDERMLPRSSNFAGLELMWRQPFPGSLAGHRFSTLLQAGIQDYAQAPDYATHNLSGALLAQGSFGTIDGVHSLGYSNLYLAGHAYLETLGLRSHWQRPFHDGKLLVGAGLAYTHIAYTQSAYDAHIYEPGIYLLAGLPWQGIARADWNLIRDHAENDRPGGNRRGMAWSLGAIYPTWNSQRLELHGKLVRLDDDTSYLPALFGNATRHSHQTLISAANIWQLHGNQRLRLEWRFQEQQDTLALFSYTARSLSLSWEYLLDK